MDQQPLVPSGDGPGRDGLARDAVSRSLFWTYLPLLVIALATFAFGGYWCWRTQGHYAIAALGAILLMLVLVSWPIAAAIAASRRDLQRLMNGRLDTMSDTMDQMSVLLNLISEQQLLSDRAKGVAFREKERDTLRRAIQEEIARQDWEAAMALANEIENSFGYKSEADRFRGEINMRRSDIVRRQIADAVAGIDRHMRGENWGAAQREAERLMAIYPADEQVQRLPQDIEARRQQHKRQLLESWHDSVNRKDVDGAIEILKRLDLYLTPAEAESMQEGARSVFKEKLNNLRTQFSVCVQDHNWNEAVRVGEEIMRDYPNTQVAREVREVIDALRQRAQGIEPEVAQQA